MTENAHDLYAEIAAKLRALRDDDSRGVHAVADAYLLELLLCLHAYEVIKAYGETRNRCLSWDTLREQGH